MNLRQLDELFARAGNGASAKPLTNKILFVGYVAIGQGDLGATVFGPHEPLVYLHSTAVNDFIQSRWLMRTSRVGDAIWLLSALFVILGGQSFLLGLLAEISVRTYYESQQKPIYVVKEILQAGEPGPPDDDPLRERRASGAPAGGSGHRGERGRRD